MEGSLPKRSIVAILQTPALPVLPPVLQSQATVMYCQTETAFANQQMWGSSLARFRKQRPKLRNHCQLAVCWLSSNRRASADLTWCWAQLWRPQHRAETSTLQEFSLISPGCFGVKQIFPEGERYLWGRCLVQVIRGAPNLSTTSGEHLQLQNTPWG